MDIRDLTIAAANHENKAITLLARVSAQSSGVANKIHASDAGSTTITMISQTLEEAGQEIAKAQVIHKIIRDEKAQPKTDPSHYKNYKPMSDADLERSIDEILYQGLGHDSGLTTKIMGVIKQERNG